MQQLHIELLRKAYNMTAAQAQVKANSKRRNPKIAKTRDIKNIQELRRQGIQKLYGKAIGKKGVEAMFQATFDLKSFEQAIERESVFLINNPNKKLCGYFQMKYQNVIGGNGICQLQGFFVQPDIIAEDFFLYELSLIERTIQEAGSCKIKGVASYKEYQLMSAYDYDISAPKYRHSFGGFSLDFVPFMKTLYYPKL